MNRHGCRSRGRAADARPAGFRYRREGTALYAFAPLSSVVESSAR